MSGYDDRDLLIRRIELELRRQPALPDDVLKKIVTVLQRGRGEEPAVRTPNPRTVQRWRDTLTAVQAAGGKRDDTRDTRDMLSLPKYSNSRDYPQIIQRVPLGRN